MPLTETLALRELRFSTFIQLGNKRLDLYDLFDVFDLEDI